MKKSNPVFVLRGFDLKQALSAVDAEGEDNVMLSVRVIDQRCKSSVTVESSHDVR